MVDCEFSNYVIITGKNKEDKGSRSYLTLVKLTSMKKNKLLRWVNNLEICNGQLVIQPKAQVLIQADASNKAWRLHLEGSE